MRTPTIVEIKAIVARWSLDECQTLAQNVLALDRTQDIRNLLKAEQR